MDTKAIKVLDRDIGISIIRYLKKKYLPTHTHWKMEDLIELVRIGDFLEYDIGHYRYDCTILALAELYAEYRETGRLDYDRGRGEPVWDGIRSFEASQEDRLLLCQVICELLCDMDRESPQRDLTYRWPEAPNFEKWEAHLTGLLSCLLHGPDEILTPEWMTQWVRNRDKLKCPVDLDAYFTQDTIAGKQLAVMDIGPCSLPSGRVLVRDPLSSLESRGERPYFLHVPPGTYRTEVCVVKPDGEDCARYAAVRLRFFDHDEFLDAFLEDDAEPPVIRFEEALIGNEDFSELEDEEYFGFGVDAGLGCICDETIHQAFCDFSERWHKGHPDGNLYDDYFAALFAQNYRAHPEYQRSGGDWLNWQIPGTSYHLPIFQSGFGDGVYPVYWKFDEDGDICELVVQFIDLQLAYGHPSDLLNLADFDVDEGLCAGKVELKKWNKLFDCEGPYTLCFDVDTYQELEQFTEGQKAGYDYLLENAHDLIPPILNELLKEWPRIQEDYGYEGQPPEERQQEIPDVTDLSGLLALIWPDSISIYDLSLDGKPYIGIGFSCSWDGEHGFGAMLCGDRVVRVGGADTALLRWIAEEDLSSRQG